MAFFEFILETLNWLWTFQPNTGNIAQLVIALVGVSAIALTQSPDPKLSRWASVLGLLGQPAWFYSAMATKNYGIFLICFLYTWAWGKGFWRNFGPSIKETVFELKHMVLETVSELAFMRMELKQKNKKKIKVESKAVKLSELITFTFNKVVPNGISIKRDYHSSFNPELYISIPIPDQEFMIYGTPIDYVQCDYQALDVSARLFLSKLILEKIKELQGQLGITERIVPASISEEDLRPTDTITRDLTLHEPLIHGGGTLNILTDGITLHLRKW